MPEPDLQRLTHKYRARLAIELQDFLDWQAGQSIRVPRKELIQRYMAELIKDDEPEKEGRPVAATRTVPYQTFHEGVTEIEV